MKAETALLHYKINVNEANPAVTPLFQTSAFTADSPYFYSRKCNPNVVEFENIIASLENASFGIGVATGMSAIYLTLDLLKPGDTVVINKYIYGCTYKLFQRVSKQRNLNLAVLDLSAKSITLPDNVAMVFFETPTNPFLKIIDIQKIATLVKNTNPKALVVVDNTWATSLYQHPLECGADISLHSCTKYYSGHSDVMGGVLLVDNPQIHEELLQNRFYAGSILPPYNAWLLRRSMQTFTLRMRQHNAATLQMLDFLKQRLEIKKVYYPDIDGKQLKNYGGIVFFELIDNLVPHYKLFSKSLALFNTGTGMACVTSMVAQPYSGSHASMSDAEKEDMGLGKGLVRLCFGMEEVEDLKNDLINGFNTITNFELTSKHQKEFINEK